MSATALCNHQFGQKVVCLVRKDGEGKVIETLGPERQISLANIKELNFLQISQTSDLVKVLTSWRYFKYKKGYNAYATGYWFYSHRMNIKTS